MNITIWDVKKQDYIRIGHVKRIHYACSSLIFYTPYGCDIKMNKSNKGLYLDKYFLYRGYGYNHIEASIKAKEYMKSVHLIR